MAKAKNILVEDILNLMDDEEKVYVSFTAYGVSCGYSWEDDMNTVKDCKEHLRYDCKHAVVTEIKEACSGLNAVHIRAEIIH